MAVKSFSYYMCDFETTVYEGQESTDVWAAGMCELYTEDCVILGSIDDWFKYCRSLKGNLCCYFHNLKFDGSFILYYLMFRLGYKQAYTVIGGGQCGDTLYQEQIKFIKDNQMKNNTFRYSISDRGQWYSILIKVDSRLIEIRDSLKLLPFSVKEIGKSFGTKHKKLDMVYEGFRYPNCYISPEEKEYLKNDVYVVKEALEIMFNQGHNKLTIGSCCMAEFQAIVGKKAYKAMYPNLYNIPIPEETYGIDNAGDYIRRSYKGGWCYLVKGKENKIFHNGITLDVNSLYPSVMHSSSGSMYPVGLPTFWTGNYIPDEALDIHNFYFLRIRTRFYLKKGYLPFIQMKGNLLYDSTENLTTSDVYDKASHQYCKFLRDFDGNIIPTTVEMTMTQVDYKLFREHYRVEDFEILDGCWFKGAYGMFDEYIDKYKEIKMKSKGAVRALAKLFLNNLYGQLAKNTNSSFKKAYINEKQVLAFENIRANEKEPGYIAIGSAITSYARNFTIRAAQKNFYGADKAGFIYADTDSLHMDLPIEEVKGVELHDSDFNHWKCESQWTEGLFVRQKTYVEVTEKESKESYFDLKMMKQIEPEEKRKIKVYDVKCAGMPEKCKMLFIGTITKEIPDEKTYKYLSDSDKEYLKKNHKLEDFKEGMVVPGKLLAKRIPGGTLLVPCDYEMQKGA